MSRSSNGTSDYLWRASSPVSGYPLTLAGWARAFSTGGIIALSDPATNSDYVGILVDNTGGVARARANVSCTSPSAFNNWSASNSTPLGDWFHAALVLESATSRTLYHNGVATAGNTTAILASAWSRLAVGNVIRLSSSALFTGDLAHCAVWSAALDSSEVAALASGANPGAIRPASLAAYYRLSGLDSPEPDALGGTALTVVGATAGASNPGVWTPWRAESTLVRGSYVG